VDCQATGYANCEATLQGGCTAECTKPEGALFCDGNYVDRGGNAQACIDAIKAALPSVTIDVSATASGTSNCTGTNTGTHCEANGQADASASCAFSPRPASNANTYGALAALAALGAVCFRRRRAH
jgi:MYXO-CTERM domain-containing protein